MLRLIAASVLAAPFALAFALPASAASFNCHKAKTDTEKTICGKAMLNVLDQRMDTTYRKLLKIVGNSGQRDSIRGDQLYWLNLRDACGADAPCLRDTLQARIVELNGYIKAAKSGT